LSDEIRYPSLNQVERLYEQIIRTTGGERGYLGKSNLEYLLDTVKDIGERLNRKQALVKKASFLLYNIILLHPFLNGNKRTAYELVRLFLRLNGYEISSDAAGAYELLLDVASGKAAAGDVERWIATNLTEMKSQ
jgi:death-on-curing protein